MGSSHSVPSGRSTISRRAASAAAGVFALALLIWAVGLAERTVEPWGDSPRALYAGVAVVLLAAGTALVALAVHASRPQIRAWPFPTWLEPLAYLASGIAVAVPLAIAATNSLQASSIGEGGPPLVLIALGGFGLAVTVAYLMRRSTRLGATVSVVLGGALMTFALIAAR
jgi:hypothetical protein